MKEKAFAQKRAKEKMAPCPANMSAPLMVWIKHHSHFIRKEVSDMQRKKTRDRRSNSDLLMAIWTFDYDAFRRKLLIGNILELVFPTGIHLNS